MRVGDHVRAERSTPTRGTWKRFAGRTGWITSVNRQRFPDGRVYVEYGVAFESRFRSEARADAWFLPDELVPA